MAAKVVVPDLGNEIEEGAVVEWLKNVGDTVAAGEPLVVIGTPKLNLEVESPVAGKVTDILCAVDDLVEVGATLATIEDD